MPTTKKMMEKYKDLMETSKSCYLNGHDTVADYLRTIDTHTKYIRNYISAVYVFNYMSDEEFNKLFDKICIIHDEYRHVRKSAQSE